MAFNVRRVLSLRNKHGRTEDSEDGRDVEPEGCRCAPRCSAITQQRVGVIPIALYDRPIKPTLSAQDARQSEKARTSRSHCKYCHGSNKSVVEPRLIPRLLLVGITRGRDKKRLYKRVRSRASSHRSASEDRVFMYDFFAKPLVK